MAEETKEKDPKKYPDAAYYFLDKSGKRLIDFKGMLFELDGENINKIFPETKVGVGHADLKNIKVATDGQKHFTITIDPYDNGKEWVGSIREADKKMIRVIQIKDSRPDAKQPKYLFSFSVNEKNYDPKKHVGEYVGEVRGSTSALLPKSSFKQDNKPSSKAKEEKPVYQTKYNNKKAQPSGF